MRRANPETPLYKQAIEWFTAAGYHCYRENSGVRGQGRYVFGFKGKPDIGGFNRRNGKALYVECKREGEKLTPEQWAFLSEAWTHRCDVFVYTEKGQYVLPEVPERMKPTGKGK